MLNPTPPLEEVVNLASVQGVRVYQLSPPEHDHKMKQEKETKRHHATTKGFENIIPRAL